MTKITLSDLVNLQNEGSAVLTINTNNDTVVTAIENTISRDGTAPNMMAADLDMDSHRILNIPDAINPQEPVTLNQFSSSGSPGNVSSVFGRFGAVTANSGDYTVAQVTGAAPIASPTFTGIPAGPTAALSTNTTQLATTAFVIANAAAGSVSSVFGRGGAVVSANGDYTATQVTNTPAGGVAAVTVQAAITELDTEKANLASPTFTGTPAAPTAAGGTNTTQLATTAFVTAAVSGSTAPPTVPQGRLTLQTVVPVMTTTQAAKTTIIYTPYAGNLVPIYNGSIFTMTSIGAELSAVTSDATKSPAAIGASKVNDWFVWNDSGTIRIGHGPDWTNDTTRSGGTALTMVSGILLNTNTLTNGPAASRGTYVGTTRSNASSQLDWIFGSVATTPVEGFFGLWNAYNRATVSSKTGDSTAAWTYNSTTWRSARAQATNRHTIVRGLDEDSVQASYNTPASGGASGDVLIGVGLDSTSSAASAMYCSLGTFSGPMSCDLQTIPGLGVHFFQAIERQVTTASAANFVGSSTDPLNNLHITFRA